MQAPTVDTTVVDLGGANADFSFIGMFTNADIVVQAVMVLLVLASLWSWTVIFSGLIRLRKLNGLADAFEDTFWSGNSLDDLYDGLRNRTSHPMAMVFVAAMREWQRSLAGRTTVSDKMSVQDRVARVMRVTIQREMDDVEGRVGILATIGSAAPFVGLFGTVWGIMNSFKSIAMSANTSLAVVAPGIAEALLATALGLVAAIPAVVAYNKQAADIGRYAGRLEGFADEFSALLSRQLDDRAS